MPADEPPVMSDWGVIDDRSDRFHAAWAAGPVRDWAPFLAGLSPAARAAVLVELVMIDLGHRWGRGDRPLLEEYLARHPDLGPAAAVPTKLVAEELRHRQAAGDPWTPEEYQRRFPGQYAELRAGHDTLIPPTGAAVTPNFGGRPAGPAPDPGPRPSVPAGPSPAAEFDMVRRLGAGAFGEVWLARKKSSGIEKAVKIVTQPADRDEARQERQALELIKNFRHPFLVATEDYWVAGNRLHIVMELADGTLRDRLKECRQAGRAGLPAAELVGYVREVADGLDYLHSKGVIHRDMKPDNILLVNGHAKVSDFGLARASKHAITSMSMAGTPGYMPPEVWGGQGGPASDQYSLAFVYAEARQGAPPLSATNFSDLMFAHMDGAFAFSDVIGPAERAVLTRALDRLPADRYPSCKEFADALGWALADDEDPGAVDRPPRRRSGSFAAVPPRRSGSFAPVPPRSRREAAADEPVPLTAAGTGRRTRVVLAAGLVAGLAVLIGGLVLAVAWGGRGGTASTSGGGGEGGGETPPTVPGEPWLPPGAVRVPDSPVVELANRRRALEQFDFPVNGVPVRFVFVRGGPVQGRPAVAPFYLTREKVTEAALRPETAADPSPPALNVTHAEARAFARDKFGGDLPTADQWDHAAGLFDPAGGVIATPGVGPSRAGAGVPHVGQPAPRATTPATADAGPFGHWDLSGNGREWTAEAADGRVPLRGRSFTYRLPLDYAALAGERKQPQAQHADQASPYTGFRVALPLK